jgi:thymidine kinase
MGKIYFYFSAMNAGKSAHLIQSAYNYIEQGLRVQIYSTTANVVSSRTGLSMPATHLLPGSSYRRP